MSLKTFIPIILIVALIAVVAIGLVLAGNAGIGPWAGFLGDSGSTVEVDTGGGDGELAGEPGVPAPTATPALRLMPVVVAKTKLPVGELITRDLITIEERPDTNIALQGGYTFSDIEDVVGTFARVEIQEDQEILAPMVALNPNDLGSFGSDLSIYVNQGEVAVAFPIDKYTGLAYAMRPGDLVDVLMTMRIVGVDPEFSTALPNRTARVYEPALLRGEAFLFPEGKQGRLEFVPEVNQVVELVPSDIFIQGQDFEAGRPIPQRVTQLTIQQANVIWIGTWQEPRDRVEEEEEIVIATPGAEDDGVEIVPAEGEAADTGAPAGEGEEGSPATPSGPTPTPWPVRYEEIPDVVILSMSAQDALILKWALERGVDIDLVLRAQGDLTTYETVSVTLPQIVEQGDLAAPDPFDFDLHPRPEDVAIPFLPDVSVAIGQDAAGQ